MVLVAAVAACGSAVSPAAPGRTVPARRASETAADCTLPPPVRPASAPPGLDLGGPALTVLRGGAAQGSMRLDDGDFALAPPGAADVPEVSAVNAQFAALASIAPDGRDLADLRDDGIAVGYGRVTIAPSLVAASALPPYVQYRDSSAVAPKLPAAAPYDDRLAWVVVVKKNEVFHGGLVAPGPPHATTSTTASQAVYDYLIFVVDARTGADALLYTEGAPGEPPSVTVPAERVSVPWTLVQRSPDGYAGTLHVTMLPCDGYDTQAQLVNRYTPSLAVVVERPVNARCGAPEQVTLPLHAAVVTWNLPPAIEHLPLGPDVSSQEQEPPGDTFALECADADRHQGCVNEGPYSTGGGLWTVDEPDNGQTFRVKVGSVFAVGPLHLHGAYAASRVATTDVTIVGPLDDARPSEINELRAWRAGTADLYVPGPGCHPPTTTEACAAGWIIHVVAS